MSDHQVTVFKPFDFSQGQKIRIEGGPRNGDWEVIGVSGQKVTLQCPISKRVFEWARFCYYSEQREQPWPLSD